MSNGHHINPDLLQGISKIAEIRQLNLDIIRRIVEAIEHPAWHLHATGLKEALKYAADYRARVLLAFTASVCPHCQALEQEVFNKADFGWWVWRNNLVLAKINFDCFPWSPGCNPPADDKAEYNKYQVNTMGFPTVFILNLKGLECGHLTGYSSGTGVTAYTNALGVAAQFNVSGGPCCE